MPTIVFICTGNSCRSQMAEAWARCTLPPEWQVYSAGVEKHGLNPRMVQVMQEAGVDMSAHYSKTLDELPAAVKWDVAVTVCDHAAKHCPYLAALRLEHIPFDDPPAMTIGMEENAALSIYRRVRDEIRQTIGIFVHTLTNTHTS